MSKITDYHSTLSPNAITHEETIDLENSDTAPIHLAYLKRHSYPLWIKLCGSIIIIAWICIIPNFIEHELPDYAQDYQLRSIANNAFAHGQYQRALKLYEQLFLKYPQQKCLRLKLAAICFIFDQRYGNQHPPDYFYNSGLSYLAHNEYERSDLRDIIEYIAPHRRDAFWATFEDIS